MPSSTSNPFDDVMPSTTPYKDLRGAVRETVKLSRSQTSNIQPTSKPLPPISGRRSHSQDSVPQEKTKPSKSRSKKGSQHADVIDRLDFTGVGPMFHHDGPFDACAPSRNRQKSKTLAPMMAWTPSPQDIVAGDSPYPSAHAYDAFPESSYNPPKKKVDAIAEAWGIHEPEPYEEFFAGGGARGDTPASSIYNGRDGHSSSRSTPKRSKDAHDSSRPRASRRSAVPPPQPIFVGEPSEDIVSSSPPAGHGPKRSKSLMHRIRRMRDSPNVPVGDDYQSPPSPTTPDSYSNGNGGNASRPTHRSQNSFLGRFGGGNEKSEGSTEAYVFVDAHTNKDLPATPSRGYGDNNSSSNGYFDGGYSSSSGLGRKTSLMKKVGRVVRGSR